MEQDLEDSLEELSEGIDVLQILEMAYDKTLKAHVVSGCEQLNSRVPSAPLLRADAIVSAASLSESSASVTSESQGSRKISPRRIIDCFTGRIGSSTTCEARRINHDSSAYICLFIRYTDELEFIHSISNRQIIFISVPCSRRLYHHYQ